MKKRTSKQLESQADAILRGADARQQKKAASKKRKAKRRFAPTPNDPRNPKAFYASWDWKKKRMEALLKHGHRCQSCGASPSNLHSIRLVVDHIKPIRTHWNLRLDLSNLQVLCDDCNMGKGHWLEADFRPADGNAEMDDEWREITRH
jgi:DNA repair exonuclease SbcCD ATPase subunit